MAIAAFLVSSLGGLAFGIACGLISAFFTKFTYKFTCKFTSTRPPTGSYVSSPKHVHLHDHSYVSSPKHVHIQDHSYVSSPEHVHLQDHNRLNRFTYTSTRKFTRIVIYQGCGSPVRINYGINMTVNLN